MRVSRNEKLKTLLETLPPHTVVTSTQLNVLKISPQHVQNYLKSGWVDAVAAGTFKRPNDTLTWAGALHSLQRQLSLPVSVGAMTALAAEGSSHYVRMGRETVYLFSAPGVVLPAWFKKYSWGVAFSHTQTKLLPPNLGIRDQTLGGFALKASAPERAILECLHLAPAKTDLMECYQVVEGLLSLRPKLMQALLEASNSIKVKRLFLFMADKAKLPVMKHLDLKKIPLGTGNRAVVADGSYDAKYQMMLPKELVSRV